MGYNTSVIVMNDALSSIEQDKDFGAKLTKAITEVVMARNLRPRSDRMIDVASGPNVNAASVIETHHADNTTLLAVGGNCATVLYETCGYRHNDSEMQLRLLQGLADKLGYQLVKKKKRQDLGLDEEDFD